MSKIKSLEDLFHHQLKDLYSAEDQLVDALPTMAKEATNKDLKAAFKDHLEETKQQKKRLEKVAKDLDIKITGETCKAMQGLIKEAKSLISEDISGAVKDAGLIADAQRVEHYEIAGYGAVVEYAKTLGHDDAAKTLQEILDEEGEANKKLMKLASKINEEAKKGS